MDKLHNKLKENPTYNSWHEYEFHQHFHWFVFLLVSFLSGFFLVGEMKIENKTLVFEPLKTQVAFSATPQTQPLVQQTDLIYQGAFRVPIGFQPSNSFGYGGNAIAYNPANDSLFIRGHDWYQYVGEIKIPTLVKGAVNTMKVATVLQPMVDPLEGKLNQINPGDPNSKKIGGQLVYNNQLYTNAWSYYDGSGTQNSSHFVRPLNLSTTGSVGPVRVGTLYPGFYSAYMTAIPPEWQALLGGPALTGGCCHAIAGLQSWGPAVSVFDPSDIGVKNPVPATHLVGYPDKHRTLGNWQTGIPANPYYGVTTDVNGVLFPSGTRSVLFFGRHGLGDQCYGPGTADPSLVGTIGAGFTEPYCYDPVYGSKGTHSYPYKYWVWMYDANDLLAVKNGTKNMWDPIPTTWELTLPFATASGVREIGGVAYDQINGRVFISQRFGEGDNPIIYVFTIGVGGPPVGDVTPPVISGISASSVTTSGATILWGTNESSDTQVEYGLTTAYGSITTLNSSSVVVHSQALTGLTSGTLYHYRVKSRDGAGNLATSPDNTFTTTSVVTPTPVPPPTSTSTPAIDITPPTVPTGLTAIPVSTNQIDLSWNHSTDDVAVTGYSVIRNGVFISTSITNAYSDTGLTPNTTYSYTIVAYDKAVNVSAQTVSVSAKTNSIVTPTPTPTPTPLPTPTATVTPIPTPTVTTTYSGVKPTAQIPIRVKQWVDANPNSSCYNTSLNSNEVGDCFRYILNKDMFIWETVDNTQTTTQTTTVTSGQQQTSALQTTVSISSPIKVTVTPTTVTDVVNKPIATYVPTPKTSVPRVTTTKIVIPTPNKNPVVKTEVALKQKEKPPGEVVISDGKIYLLDKGVKRKFSSLSTFSARGYKFSDVVEKDVSEVPEGQEITGLDDSTSTPKTVGSRVKKIADTLENSLENGLEVILDIIGGSLDLIREGLQKIAPLKDVKEISL